MATGGNWKEMFHASENGDLELVRYHLRMGIDPNYQHPEYMTAALIESIRKGHIEIAQLLLDNGANPKIIKYSGVETPMSVAVSSKNKAAIYLLNTYLSIEDQNKTVGRRNKILITGGDRGIGKATAKNLLLEGQKVVITVRNEVEGQAIVEELKEATKNPAISMIQGHLSDIQSCTALIHRIKEKHSDINVLINNADTWMMEKMLNADGLEKSFMVNYIAPYLLSKQLFPILKQNGPARIINRSDRWYTKGKVDVHKIAYGLGFGRLRTYANSKQCNALFTIDFAEEIEGSGVTINAMYPGSINTNLETSSKLISNIAKTIQRFSKPPSYGALALTWLAINEELEGINGQYFNEKRPMEFIKKVKEQSLRTALRVKTEAIINK